MRRSESGDTILKDRFKLEAPTAEAGEESKEFLSENRGKPGLAISISDASWDFKANALSAGYAPLSPAKLPKATVMKRSFSAADLPPVRLSKSAASSPFAGVSESTYYTPSDRIGRNYSPSARGMTMASLEDSALFGGQQRKKKPAFSQVSSPANIAPLKTLTVGVRRKIKSSKGRLKALSAWAPEEEEKQRVTVPRLPMGHPLPLARTLSPRGVAFAKPLSPLRTRDNDSGGPTPRTTYSIQKYWQSVHAMSDVKDLAPIEDATLINALALVFGDDFGLEEAIEVPNVKEMLEEINADYGVACQRALMDYALLSPGRDHSMGFDAKKLRNFDTWWFNDEYMSVDWRILRKTGVNRASKEKCVASVSRRLSAASFDLTRKLQALWLSGHDKRRYVNLDEDFMKGLPMPLTDFTEHLERFAAQAGNAARDDWIEVATEKILEHLELISQSKAPMVHAIGREMSVQEHSLVGAALTLKRHARSLAERSLEDFVELIRTARDSTVIESVASTPRSSRSSSRRGSLARSSASGQPSMVLGDEASAEISVIALQLSPINNSADFRIEPSLKSVEFALNNCIDVIRNASDETMSDILSQTDPEAAHESLQGIFSIKEDDPVIIEAKEEVIQAARKKYKRVEMALAPLVKFTRFFLDSEVERVNEEIEKSYSDEDKDNIKVVKILQACQKIVRQYDVVLAKLDVMAAKLYMSIYVVELESFTAAARKRIEFLRDSVLARVTRANVELIENTILSFTDIANKLVTEPQNSSELKALQAFFTTSKDDIFKLSQAIEGPISRRIKFLAANSHPFTVRETTIIHDILNWPKKMAECQESSLRIQNAEKIKREEVLQARKTFFEQAITMFEGEIEHLKEKSSITHDAIIAVNKSIKKQVEKLEELRVEAEDINEQEIILELPNGPKDYSSRLDAGEKELQPFQLLWGAIGDKIKKFDEIMHTSFVTLMPEDIANELDTIRRTIFKQEKVLKENKEAVEAAQTVRKDLEDFVKESIPLMELICTEGLKQRHFESLSKATGKHIPYSPTMSLKEVLSFNLQLQLEETVEIAEICIAAKKEFSIETAMKKMEEEWQPLQFHTKPHKGGTYILRSTDDIQEVLDDQIMKTQAIRGSRYIKPFEKQVVLWEQTLNDLQEILDNWLSMQGTWLTLEPIFSSDDIKKQLPTESKAFALVDKTWRSSMDECMADPNVINVARIPGLVKRLLEANKQLDIIQKGLSDYLETKRLYFPRFFFLSDDGLLEILSETKEPRKVQPHLATLFEGIAELEFQENDDITAMFSSKKEKLAFPFADVGLEKINPKNAQGQVEIWLNDVQEVMRRTLAKVFDDASYAYMETPRIDWITQWAGQVVLNSSQVFWTRSVTKALESEDGPKALQECCDEQTAELDKIVQLVRGKLAKRDRSTISALVVLDVHARDETQNLANLGIDDPNAFDWLCQMRYYWLMDGKSALTGKPGTVECKMINAIRLYAYEYLGNQGRLVITPLTDRCYRTLMGAIHLMYGGAPEGPAGTGKTETVKDLGKAVATQCVVFNCSDTLDYLAMAKFFKGLAGTGAWACFDEFNRIHIEVLSVVAQQILTIQRAKRQNLERFDFEGTPNIKLNVSCNAFITMNPGYAGRTELPDNLKALFRSVAMMVPDYSMIADIILRSFGYSDARALAVKIVATYTLCSEQLSAQRHYDYGMRAVMAVLRAARNLKLAQPEENESILMLRAIVNVNLPKFLAPDVPLFNGITSDLFPGVELPEADNSTILTELGSVLEKHGLQKEEYILTKIMEIYEMMLIRHGFMIVGLPFAGKSTGWKILQETMTNLYNNKAPGTWNRVHTIVINPKSINMGQLYGNFDMVTHEWTDGVLAIAYRDCVNNRVVSGCQKDDRKWIIFDGPVDAVWIENMNTVLDDNKKLCLQSGEMICMTDVMSIMFEPMDLEVASPATVSRVGVIYMEPHRLGWKPLVASWLDKITVPSDAPEEPEEEEDSLGGKPKRPFAINEKHRAHLELLVQWIVEPALAFVRRECLEQVSTINSNLVHSMLNIMEGAFEEILVNADGDDHAALSVKKKGKKKVELSMELLECVFLFSVTWSIGATLDHDGRLKFDSFMREFMQNPEYVQIPEMKKVFILLQLKEWTCPEFKNGALTHALLNPYPTENTLFDYCYNAVDKKWKTWESTLGRTQIPAGTSFGDIIVPTVYTQQMDYLLHLLITHRMPALVCGPTGTGKSAFIQNILTQRLSKEKYKPISLAFSAKTSHNATQSIIDGKLDKRKKGVFGPKLGMLGVIFVDDCNMPEVEEYGAQGPIELLRQYQDNGGWYDLKEKTFMNIVDTVLIAAMGPPGGGRNEVTPRFLRHFNVICFTEFDDATLARIFTSILEWNANQVKMEPALSSLTKGIVVGTLKIYRESLKTLLPTPLKSHYTFNLRDFAKVIQGVIMVTPYEGFDKPARSRLWVHEVLRVFSDRLIDNHDKEWLLNLVDEVSTQELHVPLKTSMQHLVEAEKASGNKEDDVVDVETTRYLFFGDYKVMGAPNRKYVELKETEQLVPLIGSYLEEFNSMEKSGMDLVVFLFAVEHVSRIARVLAMPGGNVLLVGVGGSGRKSLTRLASFMADYQCRQVEITKVYGVNEWREDLRSILKSAGTGQRPVTFLFSDTQIQTEQFVEDINSILNSGELPNLFPNDQLMEILDAMRSLAGKMADLSPSQLYNMFVSRTKQNLHVALAFSPIGDSFRNRLRKFPSLVNCCTIDWFFAWPKDALSAVSTKFLSDVKIQSDVRLSIMDACSTVHETVRLMSQDFFKATRRMNYVTPTSYLELIKAFKVALAKKQVEILGAKGRYENGLEKLAHAESSVNVMQQELEALKPKLVIAQEENAALLGKIEDTKPGVEKIAKVVNEELAKVNAESEKIGKMKKECEDDLAVAIPLLEEAVEALNTLKPSDISEVKNFKTPPSGVVLVMSAVCDMLKVKADRIKDPNDPTKKIQDYWGPAKKLLAESKFLDRLKTYDKDNIDPKIVKKIRDKYISDPNFEPAVIKKASIAAMGMCKWVRAMEAYDRVAKVVAPKKAKLKQAEEEQKIAFELVETKRKEYQKVKDELTDLENQFKDATQKKQDLEDEYDLCGKKLIRADELIKGLGGEKKRWTEMAAMLGEMYNNIVGDVLIAAGQIAYLGAFTKKYRGQALAKWTKLCKTTAIPCSAEPKMEETLGDAVVIRQWNIDGLPTDAFSVDNAIIVSNARRWPLMIDPQGQANRWIRKMEAPNSLKVIKLTDEAYMRTVESAVQFGAPVLLENVGEFLDPTLEPILLQSTFKQGGMLMIRLGENNIEYSDEFKFYITTKYRNPHYLPEISVKVTLLNFMITPEGLEDQLLGTVVRKERPDMAEKKEALIVESAENKKKLKQCEDDILHILASSEGDILEDEGAINALKKAKAVANDVNEKQKVAEALSVEIKKVSDGYIPIAFHSQLLFFCITDLASIEPTYQYALDWFKNLFVMSIQKAEKSTEISTRLKNLEEHFTYSLYKNVCRSLLEKDKLLFSFLLTIKIMSSKGEVDPAEWYFLLTGGVVKENPFHNPAEDWLSAKNWGEITRLNDLPAFDGFQDDFEENVEQFKMLYDHPAPQSQPLPGKWDDLKTFQKMLILRCIRPDKIILAIQLFVIESMTEKFVKPPPFDLKSCYDDSRASIPLIFVLSPGSDPMASLLKFAESISMNVDSISLGQGQGPKAEVMMEKAQKDGTWTVLQNCHLATSWMPRLERLVEEFDPAKSNPNYRLWCTTYPSDDFPVSILQNGVKMTLEAPKGIRNNMLGSYLNDPISDQEFFMSVQKGKEFRKLLFGLCFFHALVQERRQFGPLGWNIPYEFNESDLRISVAQLAMFVDLYPKLPFDALNYCAGQCNYGGRVTDDKDRRCLMTILKRFYRPSLLEDGHVFHKAGIFGMPADGDHKAYVEHIESFPLTAEPDVFGMHDNANITKDQNATTKLFSAVLLTQETGGGGDDAGAKSPEEIMEDVAKDILAKLPEAFNMEEAELKYPIKWEESMNTVIVQELSKFNVLTAVIKAALKDLCKAVKGIIVMSDRLEQFGKSVYFGRIPKLIDDASYPSLKPLASYVADLLQRLSFFKSWLDNGRPAVFWISGFYFTQAFLTGIKQNCARKYTIPIDNVDFDFEVMDETSYSVGPKDGAFSNGLFIDGARWDTQEKTLKDPEPKVLFGIAPVIWLKPMAKETISTFPHYLCPCYKTSDRRGMLSTTGHSTNFVMYMKLPSGYPQAFWIERGVAMLTQLDD